jgi:hypothetical protein
MAVDKRTFTFMTQQQIADKARAIVAAKGGQVAVAGMIGVSQAAVSKAVNNKPGYDEVRAKILCLVGGYEIEAEPHYKVRRAKPTARK